MSGVELLAHRARAFCPAGLLVRVNVEGFDDVGAAKVWRDDFEVRRPIHAAVGNGVVEADVIHVDAAVVFLRQLEDLNKDVFADWHIDMVSFARLVELAGTLCFQSLELPGRICTTLDEVNFVGKFKVGVVLFCGRYPAVAD